MKRAAVFGATGYGGLELVRLLSAHPQVDCVQVTSREPGRRLDAVHPQLRGVCDLTLVASAAESLDPNLDMVFLALPHGQSGPIMAGIEARCPRAHIYDLAQDFRTGFEDRGWVYGLPEVFGEAIAKSKKVASPGCFATAINLATLPAMKAGLVPKQLIIDAKTGSSGSGVKAKAVTHHPERVSTFKAYKVFEHQHEREIKAAWSQVSEEQPHLTFVPQSTPLVRGIYACCYFIFEDASESRQRAFESAYRDLFKASSFVRVLDSVPNIAHVRGTNNADLYIDHNDNVTLVISAIDNLVRGASGQAVQSMNLGFSWPEDTGLRSAAWCP